MVRKTKQDFILNKYYKFIVFIIAAACIGMMFIPSINMVSKVTGNGVATVNAWRAAFGTGDTTAVGGVFKFGFSFTALLIPILLAVGGILPLILDNKLGTFLSVCSFAAAAALAFLLPAIAMPTDATKLIFNLTLATGAILVGAFSVLCAVLGAIKILIK